MKRAWFWAALAAVAQMAVLLWMAGQREWIARYGQPIILRTAPIDPRDPMRGDYVRLDYEISTAARAQCRGRVVEWFDEPVPAGAQRDRIVYAALRPMEDGLYELESLSDQPPGEGVFLRGRTETIQPHSISVRYGLEAFFMEQGRAQEFEDEQRGAKAGVPLNVHVAVGRGGLGVLTHSAWEPLGMTITPQQTPAPPREGNRPFEGPHLTAVTVQFKNHGDSSLAIVVGPRGEFLRLVADHRRGDSSYQWVGRTLPPPSPAADAVVLLAPGDTYETTLDLTAPEWFVREGETGPPQMLAEVQNPWRAWFRIEYKPPAPDVIATLPQAEAIRPLPLRSRSFNPIDGID